MAGIMPQGPDRPTLDDGLSPCFRHKRIDFLNMKISHAALRQSSLESGTLFRIEKNSKKGIEFIRKNKCLI
jgi:hypothetical protein